MATPHQNGQAEQYTPKELSLLDQIAEETARESARIGSRYMPTLTVKQFSHREEQLRELKEMLVQDVDYGIIPGTQKPTLLLPGAQKLCTFFGYVPHYVETSIEDWNGDRFGEPLFYYKYGCELRKDGKPVGEGIGSASSWESKYRYRWLRKDQLQSGVDETTLPTRGGKQTLFAYDFAIEKAETGGQYGKPADYWQQFKDAIEDGTAKAVNKPFKNGREGLGHEITLDATLFRVPNAEFADVINTCQKMGQKRAYIAATLSATGASQYFTQDLEDMADGIDTGGHAVGTQAAADHVAQQKIADNAAKTSQQSAVPPAPKTAGNGAGSAPRPDEIPEDLQAIFANLRKPGGITEAFTMLKRVLLEALPENGGVEYLRILDKHKIKASGSQPIDPIKAALLEIWKLAEWSKLRTRAKQPVEEPPPGDGFQASDADIPKGLFDQKEVA